MVLAIATALFPLLMPPKKSNSPNPIGFIVLSVLAFGSFAYLSSARDSNNKATIETREKRIHHPNPLIPPRDQIVPR